MFTPGRIRVLALALADAICIFVVWAVVASGYWGLGQWLRILGVQTDVGHYVIAHYLTFWPVIPLFVAVNALLDSYHGNWMYPSAPLSPVDEFRRLFWGSLLTHLGVVAFVGLGIFRDIPEGISRIVAGVSGIFVALGAQSFRNWMRAVLYRIHVAQIPVLLAGSGEVAQLLAHILGNDPYSGLRIVGYFDGTEHSGRTNCRRFNQDSPSAKTPYLGSLREVVPEARRRDIKILFSCVDERMFRLQMEEFRSWFTYIEYLPTAKSFPVLGARTVSFNGVGGLEMVNQVRMKTKRVQKRLLDLALATVAFVCLSPFFVILPLLIKLSSRGPVFYRQRRLGINGKPFMVWKFRSMYVDADERLEQLRRTNPAVEAEWQRNFKLENDPRVTPLGLFLRKTSLDELPQLFNVFRGEMALIGPRPIVDEEVAYYGDAYPVFSSVRPGITGLWQVSGRSDTGYAQRVALDTYYVQNWSSWMDMWVLTRTVYAVIFMRGAR